MSNKCEACKFYVARGQNSPGNCRRNPPVLLYQPMPVQGVIGKPPEISWELQASNFPLVRPEWWCGEWQPALAIMQ
jgi:hypothetical protein